MSIYALHLSDSLKGRWWSWNTVTNLKTSSGQWEMEVFFNTQNLTFVWTLYGFKSEIRELPQNVAIQLLKLNSGNLWQIFSETERNLRLSWAFCTLLRKLESCLSRCYSYLVLLILSSRILGRIFCKFFRAVVLNFKNLLENSDFKHSKQSLNFVQEFWRQNIDFP